MEGPMTAPECAKCRTSMEEVETSKPNPDSTEYECPECGEGQAVRKLGNSLNFSQFPYCLETDPAKIMAAWAN